MLDRLFLFPADAYQDLFVTYNAAIWPGQFIAVALCAIVVIGAFSGGRGGGQTIAAVITAFWLFTGYVFHVEYFAALNWLAYTYGMGFLLQGFLVAAWGLFGGQFQISLLNSVRAARGMMFVLASLFLQPVAIVVQGAPLQHIQTFGLTPMPVVLATLGVLFWSARKPPWWLLILPVAWATWDGLTVYTLGLPLELILPGLSLIAAVRLLFWGASEALPEDRR